MLFILTCSAGDEETCFHYCSSSRNNPCVSRVEYVKGSHTDEVPRAIKVKNGSTWPVPPRTHGRPRRLLTSVPTSWSAADQSRLWIEMKAKGPAPPWACSAQSPGPRGLLQIPRTCQRFLMRRPTSTGAVGEGHTIQRQLDILRDRHNQ